MKKRLAEAEADNEARKKPVDDKAAKPSGPTEGVLDEWVRLLSFCTFYWYGVLFAFIAFPWIGQL